MVDRTRNIILDMLKDNGIRNIGVEIEGFNYNPMNDSVEIDRLKITTSNLTPDMVTGILNTVKELEVIKIGVKSKSIVF